MIRSTARLLITRRATASVCRSLASETANREADFGFKKVKYEEKQGKGLVSILNTKH